MNFIVQLVEDLSRVRSLDEVIKIAHTVARQATGADGATFILRDGDYCFYVDENAIGPLWKGKRFPMTACISGWAMIHKQPVIIPDIYQDSRIPIEAYKPTFVRSLAMVPIRQSEPIGAIGNYWAHTHTPTSEELDKLQTIANIVSVAIENVQLISSLKKHVKELELAHQVKNEFLRLISHELRTPLNSILGWSEILSHDPKTDIPTLNAGLEAIYRNSKAQLHVVERLLDASSIVLGQFSVTKEKIDFTSIVTRNISEFQPAALQKNIQITFNNKFNTAWVHGDLSRLHDVVKSLIDNALQFSKNEGTIIIDLLQEGPSVVLKVTDFGEGIAPEMQSKIFNRFSQIEPYLTRKHGGLGLSLMTAKSIAEAHDGGIQVHSAGIGTGSTFTLTLPIMPLASDLEA